MSTTSMVDNVIVLHKHGPVTFLFGNLVSEIQNQNPSKF